MPLMRALRAGTATALLALAAVLVPAWAQDLQPVPALTAHVLDATGTLDTAQLQALDARLDAFEKSSGSQVVMLLVPTTQPEDIASYANRVGNTWKIGRKDVGDGLLVVVAKNDRKIRIEVAKALEGAIPDLAAKQVIDEAMTPAFRRGDYAAGLDAAADRITALIKGEALAPPAPQAAFDVEGFDWEDLAIFMFFAVVVGASVVRRIFGRKLGALLIGAGTGAVALVVTSSLLVAAIAALVAMLFGLFASFNPGSFTRGGGGGWNSGGGGWSSGSGGGGFSSGGGGDFGGGGASGDW